MKNSLNLQPIDTDLQPKSPDDSDSGTPHLKPQRIDVSQQKRGSVLVVDYHMTGSFPKKAPALTSPKKSAFGTTPKDRPNLKSVFAKGSQSSASPATESPSSTKAKSVMSKIASFSKFKKIMAKIEDKPTIENEGIALRNRIKKELEIRLRAQEKAVYEFGEKITGMTMSYDGRFIIISSQYIESSPIKFKLTDVIKTERINSAKASEEGPLLDNSVHTVPENPHQKSLNDDRVFNFPTLNSPPTDGEGSVAKRKNAAPSLWLFDMDKRLPEKLLMGEDLMDSDKEIKCMAITRNTKFVICGWSDAVIRVYEIAKRSQAFVFKDVHKNAITSAKVTDDDKFLVAGSYKDRSISVYDMTKKILRYVIKDIHTDWLINLAISPDNMTIIAGFYDGVIKVIDREKKEPLHTFNVNREEKKTSIAPDLNLIGTMQVTNNGRYVIVGCQDKSIRVCDLENGKLVHIFDQVHEHRITTLALTPDDRYLISGSFIGSLNIIDLEKSERIHTYTKAHQGMITCSLVTPLSKHIITGSDEGSLQILSLEQEELDGVIDKVHTGGVDTIAISKNNQYIISGSYDGSISVHYLETRTFVHTIEKAHDRAIKAIKITSDNKYFFSGSDDQSIKIFEMSTWHHIYTFQKIHTDWVTSLALTTNNRYLISGSSDRSIKIINIHTRDLLHTYVDAHNDAITCLALTWDNKYIVSGSSDQSIRVFTMNFKRKEMPYIFEAAHQGPVKCLSITYDNKYVISGSTDKSIKIFYLDKRECLHTIEDAHKDTVNSVVVSKDDKYIISGSSDKCIHIFDIQRRKRLYSVTEAHTEFITTVAITEDNSRIVSGSNDNTIRIFTNPYNMRTLTITESDRILPLSYFGLFILNMFLQEQSPEAKYRILTKYPDLNIYPHGLNLFHIAAIFFPNKDLIRFCIESKINFSGDFHGRTPLYYLLNSDKIDFNIINYLLENFESLIMNSTEPYKVMTDVTQDLPTILKLSPSLVANILKFAVDNPLSYKNEELTHFGTIVGGAARKCLPYKSPIFTPEIRSKLLEAEGNNLLSIKIVLFYMDYDPCSEEMLEVLQALEAVDNEMIFQTKAISVLIDYLWDVSKRPLYLLGFIYSTFMIFLSVYASWRPDEKERWLEVLLLIFGCGFMCYKSFQLASTGITLYFADFWNSVELTANIMMIATIIATWAKAELLCIEWLMTITLLLGYAKWVSFFRIIDQTRKLIRMIIEILKAMRSFIAILIFAILGFSVIFFQFDDEIEYRDRLLLVYNLLYASFDPENFNASQIVYLVVVTIMLNVVLLNMLVAIMSGTYSQVQESSLLTDSREKIVLTLETVALKKLWKKATKIFHRRKRMGSLQHLESLVKESSRGYLFFAENSHSYDEDEAGESEWEQRIVAIRKIVRGEMQNENEAIQTRIAGLEAHISKHETKVVGLKRSLGEKLNELEANVNHILHVMQQKK